MIVIKFGGSSVRDAHWIGQVVDIASDRLAQAPVLVSSAMGKTTDRLLGIAASAAAGDRAHAENEISGLELLHTEAAEQLASGREHERVAARLETLFGELRSLVNGLVLIKECTPRTQDAILAFGELLSTTVIAAAARERGIDCRLLDSRDFIRTDENFTAAVPDFAATDDLVRRLVPAESGKLLVVQGFIAATEKGVTTTLGRGGSDWSATIIGGALGADEVQIWTDVDGIMTADPRIIDGAMTVPAISYEEAAELAYFGAKVVHPSTIQPAIRRRIPVWVKNTGNPVSPGTRISELSDRKGLAALASKKGITIITVASSRMLHAHGFMSRIFSVFAEHRISVDLVTTSEVTISTTVEGRLDLGPVIQDLEQYGSVSVESGKAIVSLVGRSLWRTGSFTARVFSALSNISVRMISLGSSDINLSLVVNEGDADLAVRALHDEFFSASASVAAASAIPPKDAT